MWLYVQHDKSSLFSHQHDVSQCVRPHTEQQQILSLVKSFIDKGESMFSLAHIGRVAVPLIRAKDTKLISQNIIPNEKKLLNTNTITKLNASSYIPYMLVCCGRRWMLCGNIRKYQFDTSFLVCKGKKVTMNGWMIQTYSLTFTYVITYNN